MKEKYYIEMSGPSYIGTRKYGPYEDIADAKCIARTMLAEEVKLDNICTITITGKIDTDVFRLKLPRELTFDTLFEAQEAANCISAYIGTILGCKFDNTCFSIEQGTKDIELKKIHYSYNRTQDV